LFQASLSSVPECNITMSVLTEVTVIIEASETSGTLIEARVALRQRRELRAAGRNMPEHG
jgi:DNA processing protein